MKTTMKFMLMLLVVASISTLTSCKKETEPKQLPETITVSGQVTDEDGQHFENVSVYVYESAFMTYAIPVANAHTDENGFYQVEYSPDERYVYKLLFEANKDGYSYYQSWYGLTKWDAVQEHDQVLKKSTE